MKDALAIPTARRDHWLLDSDAHRPEDLMTRQFALSVARGAGLSEEDADVLLDSSPKDLLVGLGFERPA